MTREEAIYRLKNMAWLYGSVEREQNIEAIDMAIEALQAEAVHKPDYSYEADMVRRLKDATSADAIQGVGRYENAMQKLREMPRYLNGVKAKQIKKISIDEVVRCKDCRHRCKDPIYSKADPHWVIYQIGDCPIICKTVGDDDYCSFGERREE